MRDEFDAGLLDGFADAEGDRAKVKRSERLARERPEKLAVRVVAAIPYHMERLREEVARDWGVDIADLDGLPAAGVEPRGTPECFVLIQKINIFHAFAELLRELEGHAADPSLSRAQLVAKVCETGIETLRVYESVKLHTARQIRLFAEEYSSEKAARETRDKEAQLLSGHLATRISMRNRRLARALDEIREHKKPASRERFETLLRELYVLAPEVWDEHHRTDRQLRATRNAVVKEIERRLRSEPPAEKVELAEFAEREALLEKARRAGLTPREHELFKFFIENPGAKNADAARAMDIQVGTVKCLKARIKKKRVHAA